tara:strand:+ start:25 stop:483 length:459 start_codon:yes stop_codon:yes gene_type:complete
MIEKNKEKLSLGDKAPLFTLKNQKGEKISLSNFKNKKNVLLIFYPGDNTPGCTKQLCALRDDFSKFKKENTIIFGINHADHISHQKFINDYNFPFDLLIDTNHQVATKYQALKSFFGKTITARSVVLINKEGLIIYLKRGLPEDKDILAALK